MPYEEVYEGGVAEEMFHRAPAIGKITSAIGWEPTIDLDGILTDVIAFTKRAGAEPDLTGIGSPATIAPGTSNVRYRASSGSPMLRATARRALRG